MISTFDNCLFVHIPKIAGQSIESVFLKRAGLNWQCREKMLLKPNSNPQFGPPRLAHLTALEYVKLGYLRQDEFDKLFKFTFVRNPWDRLVSEYLYRKYSFSFKDFLFKRFPTSDSDDHSIGFDPFRHVQPQSTFIYDENQKMLVDFVGKFENLVEDFAVVSEKITGSRQELPHINSSNKGIMRKIRNVFKTKKMYVEYYDNESKEFVANLYHNDIKLFNYSFGN